MCKKFVRLDYWENGGWMMLIFLNVVFELLSVKGEYRSFENVIQEDGRPTVLVGRREVADELKKKNKMRERERKRNETAHCCLRIFQI